MDYLDFFTILLTTQGLIFSEFTAVCNKTVWSYYSLIEGGIWTLLNKPALFAFCLEFDPL